jgi:transcriptional regulator with XRE-family HTH domain
MTSSSLPNYLVANRKRLSLSQDEVAFLLGTQSGETVSRYERAGRLPSLETALAFEAIFQKPIREIFSGVYKEIEREVVTRAHTLGERIGKRNPDPQTIRKRRALSAIARPQITNSPNNND